MATIVNNQDGPNVSIPASADLSSYQFHIVTLNTSGLLKLADDADDPVEALIGILQDKPDAANKEASVRVSGVAKVMGGAAIAPGIWVTCDSSGHAAAAVANDNVIGITLTTLASGSIGLILLAQGAGHVVPA